MCKQPRQPSIHKFSVSFINVNVLTSLTVSFTIKTNYWSLLGTDLTNKNTRVWGIRCLSQDMQFKVSLLDKAISIPASSLAMHRTPISSHQKWVRNLCEQGVNLSLCKLKKTGFHSAALKMCISPCCIYCLRSVFASSRITCSKTWIILKGVWAI